MKIYPRLVCAVLALTAIYGCGDGNGTAPVGDSYVFPAGKAVLAFTAMSTAHLPAPVSGIGLSITLPPGMSVATTSGLSGQIAAAALMNGSTLAGTTLAFGTYSASNGKTRLSMATTSDSYRAGEFLRLACTVASGTNITLGGLKALNTPVTVLKVVGYDPVAMSTVNITGKVKVTLEVPN